MKVYIVKRATGEYEDFSETIEKVFLDEEKAKKYIEKENDKLPLAQVEKCHDCHYRWKMCFKPTQPQPDCLDTDKYGVCQNYFKYIGIYPLFMEEYEVEV